MGGPSCLFFALKSHFGTMHVKWIHVKMAPHKIATFFCEIRLYLKAYGQYFSELS